MLKRYIENLKIYFLSLFIKTYHDITTDIISKILQSIYQDAENCNWLLRYTVLFHPIYYKKTDEWYIVWQRGTMNGTTIEKEWQQITTSGITNENEWQWVARRDDEWQWMTTSGVTNENKLKRMRASKIEWFWILK